MKTIIFTMLVVLTGCLMTGCLIEETTLPTLSVDRTDIPVAANASAEPVSVTSNATWTATLTGGPAGDGADWLTLDKTSAKGDGTIIITVAENPTTSVRWAVVTITVETLIKQITVTQAPPSALTVDKTTIPAATNGGDYTIQVTRSGSWEVKSSDTWCTASPLSGNDDGTITINVEPNTTAYNRSAIVTITSGASTHYVFVEQAAAEGPPPTTLEVAPTNILVPVEGKNSTIAVTSNSPWTATISPAATWWCTISPTSGNGNGTITVNIVGANTSTSSREATITVTAAGTVPKTVTVTQAIKIEVGNMIYVGGSGGNFYIGEYEVTQKLWWDVMGGWSPATPPSDQHGAGDDYPMYNVSWNDIQDVFLVRLNAQTGLNYRLPTEAEWVYAAKGGQLTNNYPYSGGDEIDDVAWYAGNSESKTHPIGSKKSNELGIYDMSGNVAEWCSDVIDASYRVFCGGSRSDHEWDCRVAESSKSMSPDRKEPNVGFRLVR